MRNKENKDFKEKVCIERKQREHMIRKYKINIGQGRDLDKKVCIEGTKACDRICQNLYIKKKRKCGKK